MRFGSIKKLMCTVALFWVATGSFIPLAGAASDDALVELLLRDSSIVQQDGWNIVHISGSPFQRGFQQGWYASESAAAILYAYLDEPGSEYREKSRGIAKEIVWAMIPQEYQQQMEGITCALNKKGHLCDVWDIVALNNWADQEVYEEVYNELYAEQSPVFLAKAPGADRCSAFIATGDATVGGKIVMGHNTWSVYNEDFMYNYMFYVHPDQGHDYVVQTSGASIWSGQDWYMNDAGLMVAETSLQGDASNPAGVPLFVRIVEAVQYTDNIDDFLEVLTKDSNGAYPNEWLIGDAKTGEIATAQLGCEVCEVHRTFNGFYYSSNYPWGEAYRAEQGDSVPEPDPMHFGYARRVRWSQLKEVHYGKIDLKTGMTMLSDHYDTYLDRNEPSARTLCGHWEAEMTDPEFIGVAGGAYDGKVTNSDLALAGMGQWVRWGHPCGMKFDADAFLADNPDWAEDHGPIHVSYLRTFEKQSTGNPWTFIAK